MDREQVNQNSSVKNCARYVMSDEKLKLFSLVPDESMHYSTSIHLKEEQKKNLQKRRSKWMSADLMAITMLYPGTRHD